MDRGQPLVCKLGTPKAGSHFVNHAPCATNAAAPPQFAWVLHLILIALAGGRQLALGLGQLHVGGTGHKAAQQRRKLWPAAAWPWPSISLHTGMCCHGFMSAPLRRKQRSPGRQPQSRAHQTGGAWRHCHRQRRQRRVCLPALPPRRFPPSCLRFHTIIRPPRPAEGTASNLALAGSFLAAWRAAE